MADKPGSGRRFRQRAAVLNAAGARNPAGLAAYIGRKKYGAERFNELAAEGRRRAREDGGGVPPAKPTRRVKV